MIELSEFVLIYSWIIGAIIMFLIAGIAHFYQKKFGERTFSYFYFFPILILIVAIFNVYIYNTFMAELAELIGVIISFIMTFNLYKKMVGVK